MYAKEKIYSKQEPKILTLKMSCLTCCVLFNEIYQTMLACCPCLIDD